jgi:hypothetical protein
MEQDQLFAEFLFNKTKVKALSNLQPQCVGSLETSSTLTPILTELQSIFVDSFCGDETVQQRPQDFIAFVKQEIPVLLSRFHKLCNGKND